VKKIFFYLLIIFFGLLPIAKAVTINNDLGHPSPHALQTINTSDSVIFDLSNAVLVNSTTIDIPVSISTNDTIYAVDFSFKFNESVLTYDTMFNFKTYLFALINFNTIDRKLRFTSSSLTPVEHNTKLVSLRFHLSAPCKKITAADFNTITVYLNGDPCSYKITNLPNYTPDANFTNSSACSGVNTIFNDMSSITGGTITAWSWNFGDGNASTLQNPITSYTNTGVYTVTLLVTSNSGCPDTSVKSINVNVSPISSFTYSTNCSISSATFIDNSSISSGSITSWLWRFGDSDSSALQNPVHSYQTSGTYPVTLFATSDSGCTSTIINNVTLTIPDANFGVQNACAGSIVNFSDSSTSSAGTINYWKWYFGDGNTSLLQNPSYSYSVAGTYTVSLKIKTNSGCSDSLAKTIVIESKPIVKFGADNLTGCSLLNVQFTDSSITPIGSTYYWSFGDTNTSAMQSPSHTYLNSGIYAVKHIVTTSAGCKDSLTKPAYIFIYDSPLAKFNASNGCVGSTINFQDSSSIISGTISTWTWILGDGNSSSQQSPAYSYSTSGTYTVSLKVTSDHGCTDSISKIIIIQDKPIVKFGGSNLTGCLPLTAYFTDSSVTSSGSTYFWSFGDAGTATTVNATHTYIANGNFSIKHIVTTSVGCSDSLTKPGSITAKGPTAFFVAIPDSVILPNATISFSNLSNGEKTSLWNFGDSTFTYQKNPTHTFPGEGIYKICLTITDSAGCTDVYCDTIKVLIPLLIAMPSAFTPNGDDANDVLLVKGGPLREMELRIFNEWGNQVFISSSQTVGWDGKYNSVAQPEGLYAYILKGIAADSSTVDMHGVINLIR